MRLASAIVLSTLLVGSTPAHAVLRAKPTMMARVGAFVGRQIGAGGPTVPVKGQPRVGLWKTSTLQLSLIVPFLSMQALAVHGAISNSMHASLWHVPLVLGAAKLGLMGADAIGGILHWGPDNYFTPTTPVVGPYVKNFLAHHEPQSMRAAGNASFPNLLVPYIPVGYAPLATALTLAPHDPYALAFAATLSLAPYSLIGHAEAHKSVHEMGPIERRVVGGMRKMGLLIEAKAHIVGHHLKETGHAGAYAALTGESNRAFDKLGVYRKAEALIFATTGAIPRVWRDPLVGDKVLEDALGRYPKLKAKALAKMKEQQ